MVSKLEHLGVCKFCGKNVANGLGGEGCLINPVLHALPSSHLFRKAANVHDVLFHQGWTDEHRKIADDIFLKLMLEATNSLPFLQRQWYKLQAYRNYAAVRLFGKKYFSSKRCIE